MGNIRSAKIPFLRWGVPGKHLHLSVQALFFVTLFVQTIFSDQICDLVGTIKIHDGKEIINCLDFASMNGDTLEVSGNVSTIASDGLALCPLIDINVITPDIVYILDQSGSMLSERACVYTNTGDTVITYQSVNSAKNIGDLEILWENGTKTIDLLSKKTDDLKPSGDPYGQAAIALHNAIKYQAARSKNSTAGYTGFSVGLINETAPAKLTSANVTNLINQISLTYDGKTYYENPLKQAKRWLNDKDLCNNDRQLIVFISDGAPTDSTKYDYLIDDDMPPIYGIFLGDEGGAYQKLEDLSDKTGGTFNIVPPKRPDSLAGVVKEIIEESFNAPPVQITLTNSSLSPSQKSFVDESKMIQQADGSWQMVLDSALGLKDGYNDIDVHLKKTEADGSTSDIYYSVTLKVSKSNSDISKLLEEVCYDMVSLEVENSAGTIVDTLTEVDKRCKLYFDVYHKTPLSLFPVNVTSLVTGDEETITINKANKVNSGDPERLKLVESFDFISDDTLAITKGNDIIETKAIDTLVFSWTNPRNPKDYVIDTVYVRGDELIFYPVKAQIFDEDENGAGDRIIVEFNRDIPEAFEAIAYYWNIKNSGSKKSSATIAKEGSKSVSYRFSNQFGKNLTAEAININASLRPIVQYASNQTVPFGDKEIVVDDKMGAVPVSAKLSLSHPLQTGGDTLRVTVSEKLHNSGNNSNYDAFIRLVRPVDITGSEITMYGSSYRYSVETNAGPSITNDGTTYTFILDNHDEIDRGSRLFLERDGTFADQLGNRSARLSVPLETMGALHFRLPDGTVIDEIYPVEHPLCEAVLQSESISDQVDTLTLRLNTNDGDMEQRKMVETGSSSGTYIAQVPVAFIERFKQNNGTIEGTYSDIHQDANDRCFAEVSYKSVVLKDTLTLRYKGAPIIDPTTIYTKNSGGTTTNQLTHVDTKFTVLLDTYRPDHQNEYLITIKSAKHGDAEQLMLYASDSVNSESDTLRLVFGKDIPHVNDNLKKPTAGNGIVETAARDTLFLQWVNPQNSSEIVRHTVIITGEETKLTVLSATITDSDENGAADRVVVSFQEILPNVITSSEVFWSSMSNSNRRTPETTKILGNSEIEYLFNNNQFGNNQTGISEGLATNLLPRLQFTPNQPFPVSALSVILTDGVGPVPTKAELYASAPGTFQPDTLIVTLSEKLSQESYNQLFRMSNDGVNHKILYDGSTALFAFNGTTITTSVDGLVIRQLLPQAPIEQYLNKLIFLDQILAQDKVGNQSSRKGVPLTYYGSLFFTEKGSAATAEVFSTNKVDSVTAHLFSQSLTANVDNLLLNMRSAKGESEQFTMSESGSNSGYYSVTFPIEYLSSFRVGNKIVEGVYLSPLKNDTTLFSTSVNLAGKEFTAPLTLTYTGGTDLYIKNKSKIVTKSLTDLDSLFHVCIDSDAEKVQNSYLVSITTADHGDVEEVLLSSSFDIDNSSSTIERVVLSKQTPFVSSDILRPTSGNGIVETSAGDTIYLQWTNPFDVTEIATDTVVVTGTPIIFSPMKATILDTNENGSADAVQIWYNHMLPEPFLYKSLYWNSAEVLPVSQFISLWTLDSSQYLTFDETTLLPNVTGPAVTSTATAPKIDLLEQDFFNINLHSCNLTDGMGAVPLDAKVRGSERNSTAPDTLTVKVSEAMYMTVSQIIPPFVRSCTPELVLNPLVAISGYENSMPIESFGGSRPIFNSSDTSFTVLLTKGDPLAAKGNFLFLNQESGYNDKALNIPARKRIPLKRFEKLYFALPENPDSALDFCEWPNHTELLAVLPVESNSPLIETLQLTITLPTGDAEILTLTETGGMTGIFTTQFSYTFTASPVQNNGLVEASFANPDVDDLDTIQAHVVTVEGVESNTILPLKYNAPPRIVKALYYPADLDSDLPDTLVLTSNVPVSWPSMINPLLYPTLDYWNGLAGGQDLQLASIMDMSLNGNLLTATTLIPREQALTPVLDSIRFIPATQQITTAAGINPINSPYTPIYYGSAPPIKVEAVPTPFTPALSEIPTLFQSYIPNSPELGLGLRVRSRLKLRGAQFTIMDGASNTVITDISLYSDESMNNLYGAWDGNNVTGRIVGNGAYLVIFRIEDILGNQHEKSMMIGVKEPYVPRGFPWYD